MRYILFVVVAGVMALPAHALTFDLWSSLERSAFGLLNADRASQGLNIVTADSRLHNAARAHSRDMASNNFFSHTGSNGSNAGSRIAAQGYNFVSWGENIAAGQQTANDVISAWLNSPGHRDNMRGGSFTDAAIGFVSAGPNANFSTYWTMVLASGDTAGNGSPTVENPPPAPGNPPPTSENQPPASENPPPAANNQPPPQGNAQNQAPSMQSTEERQPALGTPMARVPLQLMDDPTNDIETVSEVPLPPSIWLFAVALACGLVFARRSATLAPNEA